MATFGVQRAVGLAAAGLSTLTVLRKVEELPIAYHEAGHSVMAVHYESSGVCAAASASGLMHFRVGAADSPAALLWFATIVPRQTAHGHYIGETKLSVRWRHMADHAEWSAAGDGAAASAACDTPWAPLLDLRLVDLLREECAPGSDGVDPIQVGQSDRSRLVGVLHKVNASGSGVFNTSQVGESDRSLVLLGARLAYLMGGRVAEDLRAGAIAHHTPHPASGSEGLWRGTGAEDARHRREEEHGAVPAIFRNTRRFQASPSIADRPSEDSRTAPMLMDPHACLLQVIALPGQASGDPIRDNEAALTAQQRGEGGAPCHSNGHSAHRLQPAPNHAKNGTQDAHACLLRMIASPGQASGDLRQICRLVGGKAALVARPELAQQAYAYSAAVLSARWHQVQALAGAMFVLGTVSGAQCDELLRSLKKQAGRDSDGWDNWRLEETGPNSDGRNNRGLLTLTQRVDGRREGLGLLELTRPWPFVYGCVWGLLRPVVERRQSWRHPRAHELCKPKIAQDAVTEAAYAHGEGSTPEIIQDAASEAPLAERVLAASAGT
jgi:hypothetical protein